MRPTIVEHNVETGEIIEREMNDKEFKAWEVRTKEEQAKIDQLKAEEEAKALSRKSALAKLEALGLTEAEVQALAG